MLRAYSRLAVVLLLLATALVPVAEAGVLDPDMMKVALHTATPQENGFIEAVVARVDRGTLPLDLVQSTFLWARRKPRKRFYYFKQALILRAAARGIQL
jgi:hypothetical protein